MRAADSAEARPDFGAGFPASQQVNWYETFAFASKLAARHALSLDHHVLPIAGSPQWCGMADDDARKLLSLVLGGVREALAHDARQAALAEASRAVSVAANWRTVGRPRGAAYIARRRSA